MSGKTKPLSRLHPPEGMSVHEWQRALRRQFAHQQPMRIRNLGREPVFSEFAVTNPATRCTYRVVIRGEHAGVNFCSCPDYSVNTLGTCKHIEGVLRRLRRGHAQALRQTYGPPFSEVYVRYGDWRVIAFSPGQACPPKLRHLADRYFALDGTLRPEAVASFDRFVRTAADTGHELRVYDDALSLISEQRDGQARRARLRRYAGKAGLRVWNRLLKLPLYPYQRAGALFVAGAGRAILADDMGLGKTIQAVAAAEILARECAVERVLVVCPTSLKSQWSQEIGRLCARPALIIEGLEHQRRRMYAQAGPFFKIVNYDVVHRDLGAIAAWAPELVILDEAQRIKNWQTRSAKSVKRLESRYALVLTGTPLENRLEELHSIVEFVDRHRLGPLFAFKAAHEVRDGESARVVGYHRLGRIRKALAPILIRRTKQEVLTQLPPRLDKNFFVPMTPQQQVPHEENREIVARLVAKWRRYRFLTEADQLRLRVALQYMRMACDSTYLIDHQTRHHTKLGELGRLLEEVLEDREAKVVIFSQWLRMNELVAELLKARRWQYVHLHGGVPGRERKELTRTLREDRQCRVFLSTDAGGVGLNLQAASTVINMDLPWNPAVLEQRIGRVHRLGQSRPVRVVNFISEGTIEHGMLGLLAFKRSMFSGVLDGTAEKVMMGESALGRFMKTVETATSATPSPAGAPRAQVADETGRRDGSPRAMPGKNGRRPAGGNGAARHRQVPSRAAAEQPAGASLNEVSDLLQRGAALLGELGRALAGSTHGPSAGPGAHIHVDPSSGQHELRIPLPDSQTLSRLSVLLAAFLQPGSAR